MSAATSSGWPEEVLAADLTVPGMPASDTLGEFLTEQHYLIVARLDPLGGSAHDPGREAPQPGPYSSWRRCQKPDSLRPRGARSSHWYMPHRTSMPRSYAE
jgi:hypothetical protein